MKYYLVIDEWNYPTSSGREVIGDYDTIEEAEKVSKFEYESEYNNFLEVNNGEIYNKACGKTVDFNMECTGYILCSSQDETENMWFYSRIIPIESF